MCVLRGRPFFSSLSRAYKTYAGGKNVDIISAKSSFCCFLFVRFWGQGRVYKKSTFCTLVKIMKNLEDPLVAGMFSCLSVHYMHVFKTAILFQCAYMYLSADIFANVLV